MLKRYEKLIKSTKSIKLKKKYQERRTEPNYKKIQKQLKTY